MLNDIMSNNNIVVSNNEQFSYAIQKASEKKENYIISYNNIDIDNSFYSIKALYSNKERNWLNNDNISLEEYENNILRYNNYKNLVQDTAYIKYDNTINDNSLIIDNSYNSLYYVQPDKINLLSYSLNTKNGFNYNENNHTLYFNVDNKYIKSINNLLYYNYNNIRNTSPDNIGVSSTDDNYFNVKNNNNSYSNNTLTIIKEFKTEIFSTLNKIKNLYKECEVIYDTLTYFNKVNNNREPLSLNGGVDNNNNTYNSREIKFENPKLYYTNYEIGIDSLDLSNVDTIYVFDLNNAEFNIGYNNVKNYDYMSNKVIVNTSNNVNNDNKDLLKNKMSLTLAENEATADISYNHYYKNIIGSGDKYPIGTTYNININNIDENIFDNGISILYNSSPYINIDQNVQTITLPYKKELNIRKIAGSFKKYFYTTEIAKDENNRVEYLFVSSYFETKPFCVPKNSFDYLKSNNTITDCFNLQYFSSYKPGYNYDEVDPVLNIYPNNYINDKYFDSDLILYLNLEDDTNDIIRYTQISDVNQIITNENELSTCVSKIRDVYLNSVKCLYFYKLKYNEEGKYYETIGYPNMLIFEEDIDSMLTFIARNNVKFTFTTHNEIIAKNLEYSLDGVTWNKFVDKTEEVDEYYITKDSGVYTCTTGEIENSNKILWRLDLDSLLPNNPDENSEILDYLNSGYGIGIFGSERPDDVDPKFEIFGNSMSLIYGEKFKESKINKNGEEINEYKIELKNKPNIFRGLFANSAIISARRLVLPALTLEQSNYCYAEMFNGCELLGDCPSLPATTLSDRCYKGMFKGCKALRSAPRLDAKIMRAECYKEMFMNCEHLIILPNVTKKYPTGILPSTELNYGCYESMFRGCTDLNVMPQLVASIMKQNCYKQMFMGCTSISKATNMPAIQEFAKSCFYFMFHSTHIVPNVITTGVNINICQNLYFNATNDSYEHKIFVHNVQIGALQGLFGGTDIKYSELSKFLPLNSENYAYLNTYLNDSYNNLEAECYLDMFSDCTLLTTTPALPATEMKTGCYKQMFYNCSNLEEITKINVETTAKECCMSMFEKCISLTNVPILSAETLSESCYKKMFMGCEKLQVAPELPAERLVNQCYDHMFDGCNALRKITALFLTAPIKDEHDINHYDIDINDQNPISRQHAWYTDDWVKGVKIFDEEPNDLLDSWEKYIRDYSEYTNSQIEFTNLIDHEGDVIPTHIFIRNNNATWDVRDNIGVDGIPENWQIYNDDDNINRLNPVFIFFYSNSNRNYEDYSKLLYGFNGDDCVSTIPTKSIPKYDANYISSVYYNSVTGNYNKPNEFSRRGYTFKGWQNKNEDIDCLEEIRYENGNYIDQLSFIGRDLRYEAIWEANKYNITWHYAVGYDNNHNIIKEYTEITQGDYETSPLNYAPQLSDINNPVPTHQYPRNDQNEIQDGYIFWGWSSKENPIDQLVHVNRNTITNYFTRTIDTAGGRGNVNDVDDSSDSFETDLVGYVGIDNGQPVDENHFYAVWKYIVKWNINIHYNEGYYNSNEPNRTTNYYYQNNYLYNDILTLPQNPNNNNTYRFGGWATYQGPVGNDPYIPDMYTDNIQNIYTSIKNGTDVIPTNIKSYYVTKPENYYATWRYEIIWYGYNNNTETTINYGYYNDKAENYRPSTDPTMTYRTFIGWNAEPNQRVDNLNTIVIHNSRSNDNTIYPVWKYHVYWYTRGDNVSSHGHYNSDQIDNVNYFEDHYEYKEYLYGDTLILPTKNPTRNDEDYIFDNTGYDVNIWPGWADYPGPSENTVWKPNIPKSYQINDSDMFYAVYKPAITWYYFDNNSYTSTYGYKHNYFSNNSIKTYGYYNENALSPTISDTKPTDPDIYRYKFNGWNTSANQTTGLTTIKITNPESNKIYAVWKYSIYWYTYGGSYSGPYSSTENGYHQTYYYKDDYLYGNSLTKPTDPTRTLYLLSSTKSNYKFDGWATYQGPSGSNVWSSNININTYKVTDSVDFYAVWQSAIYWYSYNESTSTYTLFDVTYGNYNANVSNYKPSQNPTRTGYTFKGWNTSKDKEADNTSGIKVKDYYENNSNNVFYAAYTVDTYTITFIHTGYTLTGGNFTIINDQVEVAYNTTINSTDLPTGIKTGYKSTNEWTYNGDTVTSSFTMPANNIELTIVSKGKESYTIKFIYPDGYTLDMDDERDVTFDEEIGDLPTGTKDGYEPATDWTYSNNVKAKKTDHMPAYNINLTMLESGVEIYEVKFILTGSVYNKILDANNIQQDSISVNIRGGNTLGTLPTAIDTNGIYNESCNWKTQDNTPVTSETIVNSNMTLVPAGESMSIEPLEIIYYNTVNTNYTGTVYFIGYDENEVQWFDENDNEWKTLPTTIYNNTNIPTWTFDLTGGIINGTTNHISRKFRAVGTNIPEGALDHEYGLKRILFESTSEDLSLSKTWFELCGDLTSFTFINNNFNQLNENLRGAFSHMMNNSYYVKYANNLKLPKTTGEKMCEGMFNSSGLNTLPQLPAIQLAEKCYKYMFKKCNNLESTGLFKLRAITYAEQCCEGMFSECNELTYLNNFEIPADANLATQCYFEMFSNCKKLKYLNGFKLSPTSLGYGYGCYMQMFEYCESLITAPELPATTLADYCYDNMFYYCESLTTAPELPATQMFKGCYERMFENSGLTSMPELPANILEEACYAGMFSGCKSLTRVESLPATTLAKNCYSGMFAYCEYLTSSPHIHGVILAEDCYTSMFSNCIRLTTPPGDISATVAKGCCEGMFYRCKSLTESPILRATNLEIDCYKHMFYGCSSLTHIYCYAENINNNNSQNYMFEWVAGSKTDSDSWERDGIYYGVMQGNGGIFISGDQLENWYTLRGSASGVPHDWSIIG